jgi:hypothetical protein
VEYELGTFQQVKIPYGDNAIRFVQSISILVIGSNGQFWILLQVSEPNVGTVT